MQNNAISILKADHKRVNGLFKKFEDAKGVREKKKIVTETLTELKVHATLEEEIFYAAVRRKIDKDTMNEADEEHHVAKVLIAELEVMAPSDSHYDAKFTVLSENVKHHIREEENEMLPKAAKLKIDFEKLGDEMLIRKEELLAGGFPKMSEETMVGTGNHGDSPAKAARKP